MRKDNKKDPTKTGLNGWHVLLRFVDGIFDLINNSRIYPAFGLILFSIMALVIYKLPDTELAIIMKTLINEVVVSKGGIYAGLIFSNLAWLYLFTRMRKIKDSEIKRLSKLRNEILQTSERKSIESHRSSEEVTKESYIFPSAKANKENRE